jgi:hypothetical protein
MTNSTVSDIRFFWESFSRFQQLKIYLGYQNRKVEELKTKLKAFSLSFFEKKFDCRRLTPLHQAIAYVASYSDPVIEKMVAQKFCAATPQQRCKALASLTHFSIDSNLKNIIEVCQRVMGPDLLKETYEIKADIDFVANGLAQHLLKKSNSEAKADTQSFWRLKIPNLAILHSAAFYAITLVEMAYGIDFTEKPTGRWAAQYQLSFFRTTLTDLHWLGKLYVNYFSSARKAALVTTGILTALFGIYFFWHYIHSFFPWFRVSKPAPSFDKQLALDLTEEARAGKFTPSLGREKEMERVENLLSCTSNTIPPIVILIGPSGAGKSQIMEGLALRIAKKQTARLNDKTLIVLNTADMGEKGTWSDTRYLSRVDMIFEGLKGSEGDVIVGFDEAHMFDKKTTEKLKTIVSQKKIRVILATTAEEFINSFLKQGPILTRTHVVPVYSLDPENTRYTLLTLLNKNPDIPATPGALDMLLEISSKLPGAEPRKSLNRLNYLIQVVNASIPRESRLLPLLHRKYQEKKTAFTDQENLESGYCLSQKGLDALTTQNLLDNSIKSLIDDHQNKLKIFSKIQELKIIEANYRQERSSLAEELARNQNPLQERKFIFTLRVILPVLKEKIKCLMPDLKTTKVAVQIAGALLQKKIIAPKEYKEYSPEVNESINFIIDERLIEAKRTELSQDDQTIIRSFLLSSPSRKHGSDIRRSPSGGQVANARAQHVPINNMASVLAKEPQYTPSVLPRYMSADEPHDRVTISSSPPASEPTLYSGGSLDCTKP